MSGARRMAEETGKSGFIQPDSKKKSVFLFTAPEKVSPLSEDAAIGQLSAVHAHKMSKYGRGGGTPADGRLSFGPDVLFMGDSWSQLMDRGPVQMIFKGP
ncbi:hypothetical protein AVEN_35523-1 [Araneus ventricosus]|uniref:Uncharacterized protein n=1 Tax=Araneus ventricosus TaxID=182803 RepID=A0A4Y2GSX1_ARAVE|nr:hypothetical protein AVEN_35523-1 [Araneus ventricosus]